MVRQSGRHRRRLGTPLSDGARPVGGLGLGQRLASGGVGETAVVVDVGERQLLPQARLNLA